MNHTPLVSVLVPIFKVEPYIERCAHSLFSQTLDDIEYIFINDCTPDSSIELLQNVLSQYPMRKSQVRILSHDTNRGSAAARTTGLKAATGLYVIQCDSDDWVDPDMYKTLFCRAEATGADIVCCNFISEYTNHQTVTKFPYIEETRKILQTAGATTLNSSLWNKLVKRQLYTLHDILPFPGVNMNEDLGIMLRLRYLSKKTIVVPKAFYHYNRQNESSMVVTPKLAYIEDRIKCAQLLDDWFSVLPDAKDYNQLIYYIKFLSKSGYFLYPEIQDIKKWRTTYPESNKNVWQYKVVSIYQRTAMWLVLHGCPRLGKWLINLRPCLRPIKTKLHISLRKLY